MHTMDTLACLGECMHLHRFLLERKVRTLQEARMLVSSGQMLDSCDTASCMDACVWATSASCCTTTSSSVLVT